jgi:hypothetical protein
MRNRHTNFEDFPLTRALGDAIRERHPVTKPLPERWLELLAKLDGQAEVGGGSAPAPSFQPKLSEDDEI